MESANRGKTRLLWFSERKLTFQLAGLKPGDITTNKIQ